MTQLETWLDRAELILAANQDKTLLSIIDLETAIRRHRVCMECMSC